MGFPLFVQKMQFEDVTWDSFTKIFDTYGLSNLSIKNENN